MTKASRDDLSKSFWTFSITVYGKPGVKEACLTLQEGGLDVNLGLWIAWTVFAGRDPARALEEAIVRSELWSAEVVKPLRAARTGLKIAPGFVDTEAAQALRKRVLGAELEAERLEQLALEPLAHDCPASHSGDTRGLALDRLDAYAAKVNAKAQTAAFIETVFDALEKV